MVTESGLNQTVVSRIWRTFGVKPHPVDEWKLSTDPFFVERSAMSSGSTLTRPITRWFCVSMESLRSGR